MNTLLGYLIACAVEVTAHTVLQDLHNHLFPYIVSPIACNIPIIIPPNAFHAFPQKFPT